MEITAPKYFLGANSGEGFVSHFTSFYKNDTEWRIYILKGGPGTGKSSFMKYIAASCFDKGLKIEMCPCSSDPHSLDGIIIPEIKTAVLDGTAPHIVEPQFPGVVEEIINLGAFWDSDQLKAKAQEIVRVQKENGLLHKAARGYLFAAGELMRDNYNISLKICDRDKTEKYAFHLAKKLISPREGQGREDIRFIGGVTPLGVIAYTKSVTDYYKSMVILEDSFGGAAGIFMGKIREYALKCGYDIITLKNPFLPSLLADHILIPQLSLAFCREYEYVHFEAPQRRIHANRFYDAAAKKHFKGRICFNKKMTKELLGVACSTLKRAKLSHDELEKYYISTMDFERQSLFAIATAKKILSR